MVGRCCRAAVTSKIFGLRGSAALPKINLFMPYDPTKPVNGSLIVSAEMRNQFAGLKDLIDAKPSTEVVDNAIFVKAANNIDGFEPLSLTISNPPTQGQVQAIVTALNDLITALQH